MRTSATAVAESEDGYVTVEFEDGSQMEMPVITQVNKDDEVQVLIDGDDAIALGSSGWGDTVYDRTLEAYAVGDAAQTIAEEAQAVAEATNQHFWVDDNGIHVSSDESDDEGERNVLINSLGLLFRRFGSYLATLTESAVSFWDGSGNDGSHVLAFLGKDGSRIGDAESANTIVTDSGFAVRTGAEQRIAMGVSYVDSPGSYGRFRKRKVGKVYIAGYMDPDNQYIDRDTEGKITLVPLTDPGARLFIGNYDQYDDVHWVSDGNIAGIELPLMSIDELIEISGDYFSFGDISQTMQSYYSREVSTNSNETASYFIGYDGSSGNPLSSYLMNFDAETLAAIPQDTWTDEAIAHGAPNWFIGSIYEDGTPFATIDGVNFATASDLAGYATQTDIADMATQSDIANMATQSDIANMLTTSSPLFRIVNVSFTTASIAVSNGVSSNMSIASSVPDGYTAIGIVGTQSNHGQNWYDNSYINVSTQTLYYNIKHAFGSGSESCTLTWKLLCIPSDNYS